MKNMPEQPNQYKTTNALLAYCLYLAGVPFVDSKRPCMVFYSEKIIQRYVNGAGEPIYRGWPLQDAVEDAWKKRKLRGHIEYIFKVTTQLKKLLRAYQDQEKQLKEGTGFASDVIAEIAKDRASGNIDPDVALVREMCVILKMRMPFMDAWESVEPIILVPKEGEVKRSRKVINTKHGPREAIEYESPGFTGVSLYASKETREKLGV